MKTTESTAITITDSDVKAWCEITEKLGFPVSLMPKEMFHTWVKCLPNNPVELCILRRGNYGKFMVGLAHRDDQEFPDCYHTPGSVILPGETLHEKIGKLLKREMDGVKVTEPQLIGIYSHRGPDTTRQHEDCFLFSVKLDQEWTEELEASTKCKFFYLDQIPENTLSTHKEYIEMLKLWLEGQERQSRAIAAIGRMPDGTGVVLQPARS